MSSTHAAWRLWSLQHSVSQAELVPCTKSSPVAMWSRLAVCACLVGSVAAMCPDDPEVDLCEVDEQETSHSTRNGAWMALLLPLASTRPSLATSGCCDLRRVEDLLQERAVLRSAHSRGLGSSARNRCLPVLLRQACLLHCRTSDASRPDGRRRRLNDTKGSDPNR